MDRKYRNLVDESLRKARRLRANGHYGSAYAHYITVIELAPDKKAEVEEEFTDTLCRWGLEVAQRDFFRAIVAYRSSLKMYPHSAKIYNNCASLWLRNDSGQFAVEYLEKALDADPDFLPAEWNLDYAYSQIVDRWHYPMLNDRLRNTCFANAIREQIKDGQDSVVDIGTGSGLLALYARDSGAKSIFACEMSEEMCHIARDVFAKNQNGIKEITLCTKHSKEVEIPRDIPEKVKLIVTETFDAGLFGERALSTLIHAHENILADDGVVIPKAAQIFAAAVQSSHLRFLSFAKPDSNNSYVTLNFRGLDIHADNKYYDVVSLNKDDTVHITDPIEILSVDFNNASQIKKLLNEHQFRDQKTVECKVDGTIDGLIIWFKLIVDEKNIIDTSDDNSCWQLAVFYGKPLVCKSNQRLEIVSEIEDEKLTCTYHLDSKSSEYEDIEHAFSIPQSVIMFLNDNEYMSAAAHLAQLHKNRSARYIFDQCPFPIYGLEMLKHNSDILRLYCYAETDVLYNLIMVVAEHSGINTQRILGVDKIDEIDRQMDIIFHYNFSYQGAFNDWSEPSIYEASRLMLSTNGLMLPHKMYLIGQLVYSEEIPKMIIVDDINLSNQNSSYTIGKYINKYTLKQRFDLDSTLYKAVALSDEKVLIDVDERSSTNSIINFGKFAKTNTCLPNAMICWYRIYFNDEIYIDTKRDNSFMNHSAIIFDNLKDVMANDKEVVFNVLQMNGLTRVTLVE